jgi:hypothetical protein
MLGTVDARGNVFVDGLGPDDPLEWNAYADPSAVSAVVASGVPMSLVTLDGTADVPVPPDLADTLRTDHQAAGADLVYELLIRNPERLQPELGQQLWDELAALTVTDPDLVSWEDAAIAVGPDGRLVRDEAGPTVRFTTSADRAAVETALLEALRRGAARATPFTLAGSLEVTFDGTACSVTGASDGPGIHEIRYEGPVGGPSGVLVAGLRSAQLWDEFVDLLRDYDPGVPPPEWLVPARLIEDPSGTGAHLTGTGRLDDEAAGIACFSGSGAGRTFVPGRLVPIGGGVVPAQ